MTRWFAISVPAGNGSGLRLPVPLAPGITLHAAPAWLTDEQDWHVELGLLDREAVKEATTVFVAEYEADALGSADPNWTGRGPRSIQNSVDVSLALSSLALWIARPSPLACGIVMHFEAFRDEPVLRSGRRLEPIIVSETEAKNELTDDDFQIAAPLATALVRMPRGGALWTAISMLLRSLPERQIEIRYLLHWVALEALFGPDSGGETVHQLSERIAFFLGTTPDEKRKHFATAKSLYDIRSKIVHGRVPKKFVGDASLHMIGETEQIVRLALRKILLDHELTSRFASDARNEYLAGLAFEAG
jgi:hypothetical protein